MSFVRFLSDLNRNDLLLAGGKGANLGEMMRAGLVVPPGFCVLTDAYQWFCRVNGLNDEIKQQLSGVDATQLESLEEVSSTLRNRFMAGEIPDELANEILEAYRNLCGDDVAQVPVAVRSSATAEDLPDLSFAGQQDTYLNIVGTEALLLAVKKCWGSLWTARAIGYRNRAAISQQDVSLAVVVQQMIFSEAAGVMFTVNPLTGKRTETVIDATVGLGEALVAGKVEPDHYVVEAGQIKEKMIGAKALSIRAQAGGGTVTLPETFVGHQALDDKAILELVGMGKKAEEHFRSPQDIEWCWTSKGLWLVQSRPITSLFPLPEHKRGPDHLMVLINFGAVQGVMDPITPVGRDLFTHLVGAMAPVFGSSWTTQNQTLVYQSAERIFFDISSVVKHPFGSRIIRPVLGAVEPGSIDTLDIYRTDPRLAVQEKHWGLKTRIRLIRAVLPNALRVVLNLLLPGIRRRRIQAKIENTIRAFQSDRKTYGSTPRGAIDFLEGSILNMPPRMILWLMGSVATGQVAFQGLRRLVNGIPDGERLALEVMRGLPHNVTTEMDLALWETAQAIRHDPNAAAIISEGSAAGLASDFLSDSLPESAQLPISQFMERYGMRGVGEIDLGRIRWREDPTPVMQSIKSYLKIDRPDAAPDVVFARGAEAAQRAIGSLADLAKKEPGGWWKAPMVQWLAHRARELAGLRESPKLTIIRIFGEIRAAMLAAGAVWCKEGWLRSPQDFVFLRIAELKQLAREAEDPNGSEKNKEIWKSLVEERRSTFERERRRRQSPRLLMGDGTAVYEGVGGKPQPGERMLIGSPVSPGQVEGRVHVVLDPFGTSLAPGEILVCPGTDPAWTPLFLSAGGLVMEVGGLMTHGSVVAREYGIPAVVGVGQATLRLKTGMKIRVDGSAGKITILEDDTLAKN